MKAPEKPLLLPSVFLVLSIFLAGLLLTRAGDTNAGQNPVAPRKPPAGKNRLIFETSPYLLQHAENPVDWYPWGEEAFAKAKAEDKPIFLSVGYSTCYWCQVMERQSFADPATAKLLNQHFVSIKVDREERPDVDEVYMAAVLSMTGSGGWPMSVFLTPDLKPFYGGTYFPNAEFKTLLARVRDLWSARRSELLAAAEAVTKGLQSGHRRPTAAAAELPPAKLIEAAARRYAEVFDQTDGGFGRAPKFPQPAILELLLADYQASGRAESLAMVRQTLDAMARGGMYDQVAGGFHRYSTDRKWLVPHFEKMLYDNAQLLHAYARAYQVTGEDDFRRIAEQIAEYVGREMTGPKGLFFSAQDSNVDGEEGRTYVWARKDLEKVLSGKDLTLASRVYGVDGEPNFEGRYILHWPRGFEETARREKLDRAGFFRKLDPIRAKLLAARQKLEQPPLDDKSVTAWNGLMIEALAYTGEVLKKPAYIRMAESAARELLFTLRDADGNLLHVARKGQAKLDAYLDDYATSILGLVELNRVTGEERWRAEAAALAEAMIAKLWEPAGGFRYAPASVEHLLVQPRDSFDGAFPTGNSLAARALVRLAASGEPRYAPYAAGTLRAFAGQLEKEPRALPYMLWGLAEYRLAGLPEKTAMPGAEHALPRTSDRVSIAARLSPAVLAPGQEAALEVTISMDEGWHIVANPTSLDTLIPTSVEAEIAGGELRVAPRYPAGKKIDSPLGKVAIYEDGVTIPVRLVPVRLPKGQQSPLVVSVKAQACNDTGRCLLPSTLRTEIPVTLSPGRADPR